MRPLEVALPRDFPVAGLLKLRAVAGEWPGPRALVIAYEGRRIQLAEGVAEGDEVEAVLVRAVERLRSAP